MTDEEAIQAPIKIELRLPSMMFLARPLREFVRLTLDSTDFDEEDIDDVCLVMTEVVNNSMEHASARPHEVEVDIEIDDEKLLLRVRDEGEAKITQEDFDQGSEGPPNHLEDRGRGLFLIASFSDDVKVRALPGGGTEVRIVKYRKGKA